jgi:uncharacterized protein (TIGR03000 family)
MTPRRILSAACLALLAAGPAFGQWAPYNNYPGAYVGSQVIVRPPAYALGYGAYNPNTGAPAFVPGVGLAYYPNNTGLRPSYWALPGRYNAYPWSGAGVFTGGTATYSYYWPSFYGSSAMDVGLASPYMNGYGPYGSSYGNSYDGGGLYQADVAAVTAYRAPSAASMRPSAPADRAILNLQVPADATVWVQGTQTKQTGTERTFVSPSLTPGLDYTYTVKAQWKAGDKTIEQSQNITVRPGERSGLLFLSGNETAKLPQGR